MSCAGDNPLSAREANFASIMHRHHIEVLQGKVKALQRCVCFLTREITYTLFPICLASPVQYSIFHQLWYCKIISCAVNKPA